MQHVYVTDEDRLYSFASSSVVTIDAPRPAPARDQSCQDSGVQLRVVDGEPIFYAGIALTNLCNLTCRHCPISVTTSGVPRSEWSVDAFTRLIDDLADQGLTRVSVTGGEPFLHPHIVDLFAVLCRHGIESKINTNGLLADPAVVLQLADYGLVEIDVSINDPDDDSVSYRRTANHAADRLAAVGRLVERCGDRLAVTASSVLTRHMLTRLEVTEDELAGLGVGRWRLREMLPSQAHSLADDVVASPDEAMEALTRFAARPRRLLVYGYLIDAVRGVPAGRRCRNLERHYVYVSYDGQCWWMSGLTGAPLGDVTADGVPTIAARLREYRATMEPPARCVTCPARFICSESPASQILTAG
jgi:MoaA/NifB/PqqE/SkfB family radical SAM enzyme